MSNHAGMHFDNYKLISLLGRGGYAEVYLAEHRILHRQVAIKVFNKTLSSQQKQRRFREEAQLLEQIQHPHIIPILASGITGDRPYLVMDYASHGSLRNRLTRDKRDSLATVVSYVKQIAEALQYIHAQKIIHRDVKPENLLFNQNGEVLLADFGIAVIMDEAHRRAKTDCSTEQSTVPPCANKVSVTNNLYSQGTIAYMAPEQLEERASTGSDQYALAVVVYEWLTGQSPFLASPQETWLDWAQEHQNDSSLDAPQLDPSIPPEVGQVILKALAKQPKDRYADVATFAAALQIAAEQRQKKGTSSHINRYKQQFNKYEQLIRTDSLSEQERPSEEEKPLAVLLEYLTKPYMEKALIHLSWIERSCLLLHVDARFTPDEIAEILSIEESCVHQHLEHGRQQLLDTYNTLLEQEQGISLGQEPSQMRKNSARVERLMHRSS